MELQELAGLGKIRKELTLFKNTKLVMHSLSVEEQEEVLKALAGSPDDLLYKTYRLQIETLVRAIEQLGNVKFFNIEEGRKVLMSLQKDFFKLLWDEYEKLESENKDTFETLKKNSEMTTVASSGNTAKHSK